MVSGWEKLRTLGSKRAMMDDCGKVWVKYSSEMCVRNGELFMIWIYLELSHHAILVALIRPEEG